MKKCPLILLVVLISQLSYSQIEKTEYKVIDEISAASKTFLGAKTASLNFRLVNIRNLITKEEINGIEVEVNTSEIQTTGASLSFSNFSNLWGSSANIAFEKLKNSGLLFLSLNDALEAYNFINDTFTKVFNTNPQFYENYKITVNEQMEMGYYYDIDSKTWRFFTSVNGAVYNIEIYDGIKLVQKLGAFAKYNSKQ